MFCIITCTKLHKIRFTLLFVEKHESYYVQKYKIVPLKKLQVVVVVVVVLLVVHVPVVNVTPHIDAVSSVIVTK